MEYFNLDIGKDGKQLLNPITCGINNTQHSCQYD